MNSVTRYVDDLPHPKKTNPRERHLARAAERNPNVVALFALALALAVAGFTMMPREESAENGLAGLEAEDIADGVSTPRIYWKRGLVPLLLQTDPEWADVPYAGGTIATHGCGPTSLSMVYVGLTGKKNYDPPAMAAFSQDAGFVEEGVTSWLLMSDGARQLGLVAEEVPGDAESVCAELRAGHPIICSVGPGDFTDNGHFIVLCGLDGEGRAIVRDPNSAARSAQPWDVARVVGQCRNIWSFTPV